MNDQKRRYGGNDNEGERDAISEAGIHGDGCPRVTTSVWSARLPGGARICLIFALSAALAGPAAAQSTGGIRGTVFNADTRQAVKNAVVRLKSPLVEESTRTNARGYFAFWSVPPGPVTVSVAVRGYTRISFPACVHAGIFENAPVRIVRGGGDETLHRRASVTGDLYSIGYC
jgi:hypothetical protein